MRIVFAGGVLLSLLAAQQPVVPVVVGAPTRLGSTGLEMVLPSGFVAGDVVSGSLFAATGADVGRFRENLNLTAGPEQMPKVADTELKNEMVVELGKVLQDYEFVEDGRMDVRGRSAWWLSSRFTQDGVRLRNLQVLVPGEPCVWFTFTTTDEGFAVRQPEVRARLATLRAAGEAVANSPVVVSADGKRLIYDEYGFSFEPPEGWLQGAASILVGPFLFATGKPVDGFAPSVNVRHAPAAPRMDPRVVRQELEAELPKLFDRSVIHECAVRTVGKLKPVRARVTCHKDDRQLHMLLYYVPGKPHSFVVTYTVAGSEVDRLLTRLDASAATIAIVEPGSRPVSADKPK
ncbi:MAG: hypothetical protein IPK26_23840 [Planctomycetes bacterium]|nr:hypothetical protein [Planctomycetota bacterium]